MSGFRTRIITAVFFVLSMIAGVFGHPVSLTLLFVLLSGLCLFEFFTITLTDGSSKAGLRKGLGLAYGMSPAFLLAIHYWLFPFPFGTIVLAAGVLFLFLSGFFILELFSAGADAFEKVGYILLGSVYIGLPFAMAIHVGIGNESFRPFVIFGIILLIWANDTFAYLLGSWIGKTPLIPRVSPKKTWEGTISGILITVLVSWLYFTIFGSLNQQHWLIIGGFVAIFGTIGDLVESMLKRSFKAKDSGGLLPGHGGFLDRFDSFLFVIPFVWVYLVAVKAI